MLRTATADDWAVLMGGAPMPDFWLGLTIEERGRPVALGCIYEIIDGRFVVSFRGERRPLPMQRGARSLLAFAREQGIELYALASPTVAGAVRWMEWWGFQPTDEIIEGHKVYKWTP